MLDDTRQDGLEVRVVVGLGLEDSQCSLQFGLTLFDRYHAVVVPLIKDLDLSSQGIVKLGERSERVHGSVSTTIRCAWW